MTVTDIDRLDALQARLAARLLAARAAPDRWEGRLASSALATGTAVLALALAARYGHRDGDRLRRAARSGCAWLVRHQNEDGGWGDTPRSRSNISTTAIVWAVLGAQPDAIAADTSAVDRASAWLRRAAGDVTPAALSAAILPRYGRDRTFSVPILTVLALTGRLGADPRAAWRTIPQLPFELAALPHRWFQHLRLPVVSYALPALIAMGQARHRFAPTRNPVARVLRAGVRRRTLDVLADVQPDRGGYLEATPLTSFVVMSLAAIGEARHPVVERGAGFLVESMRDDGSWPIDTHLATWVTTLAARALADAGALSETDAEAIRRWLIDQQTTREHPFTHAAPGAWAWTPLSGGVPDADDTAGALLALGKLRRDAPDARTIASATAGLGWLLDLQNRDGGVPTFCRGWGTLPFDRSTPEITAHALQAWSAWVPDVGEALRARLTTAAARAVRYLCTSQRPDGTWIPLWFGNEAAPDEENPVYGTARVLLGLQSALARQDSRAVGARRRAVAWLLGAQQPAGGWGGAPDVPASIEETGVAIAALARAGEDADDGRVAQALTRGVRWLAAASAGEPLSAAPIGLYFARLWYYEDLYPLVFALAGVAAARNRPSGTVPVPR